ncbi:MAG: hypothetical protein CMB56_000925 [Methanobacteriota archaeon]|nr:MAG: hypothetical protein CMB56_000925 [Euryarchaeota archaeon]|tara:strand:- start:2724 stop:2996 length:273 start_codon:yes stop_codon:yes gene_type:complete
MTESDEVKKKIIQFLKLCVNYADKSLNRKKDRLENLDLEHLNSAKKEIEKWKTYKQFTEYTIKELSDGDLDEWINNLDNPDFNPSPNKKS